MDESEQLTDEQNAESSSYIVGNGWNYLTSERNPYSVFNRKLNGHLFALEMLADIRSRCETKHSFSYLFEFVI